MATARWAEESPSTRRHGHLPHPDRDRPRTTLLIRRFTASIGVHAPVEQQRFTFPSGHRVPVRRCVRSGCGVELTQPEAGRGSVAVSTAARSGATTASAAPQPAPTQPRDLPRCVRGLAGAPHRYRCVRPAIGIRWKFSVWCRRRSPAQSRSGQLNLCPLRIHDETKCPAGWVVRGPRSWARPAVPRTTPAGDVVDLADERQYRASDIGKRHHPGPRWRSCPSSFGCAR